MQPRTTAILLVVALALGGFVYFYEILGQEGRDQAEEDARRLFPEIEPEDVARVELTTSDGVAVELVRGDSGWRVAAPLDFPADAVNADSLASTLATLVSESVIESPGEPAVYGLDAEAGEIRFGDGVHGRRLRVGRDAPVGGSRYVATGADPERVYLVEGWKLGGLERSFTDLRDRGVLDFEPEQVKRIDVSWPGERLELEAREDGWWIRSSGEAALRADDATVNGLIAALSRLRATGFVDEARDAAAVGLDDPHFAVSLMASDEGVPLARFEIGRIPEAEDHLARGGHPGTLYRIPAVRLADFPRERMAYRFKRLVEAEVAEIGSVSLVFPSPSGESSQPPVEVSIERSEDGWTSNAEPLAPGAAAQLVASLAGLEAASVVAESLGADERAALELEPANVVLLIRGQGEAPEVIASLHLGRADAERGIVAKRTDRDTIYALDFTLADSIPTSYAAYLDSFVAPEPPDAAPEADPDGGPIPDAEAAVE